MTFAEAKIYLPYTEEIEIEDLYEEKLFEFKQFFLTQVPIEKVFLAKLSKLEKLDMAYQVLTNTSLSKLPREKSAIDFPDEVQLAFHLFEGEKSKLRIEISRANHGNALKFVVQLLLDLVKVYRQKWAAGLESVSHEDKEFDVEIGLLSREPDPMEIQGAIEEFTKAGGVYFSDIFKQKNNLVLMKEMKRVSLLIEKY